MSFVYAEKVYSETAEKESIRILCDTKIEMGRYSPAHFSAREYRLVSQYGIVKSTICNPQLCISFAGNNILYASKLFRELAGMESFELPDVSELALKVHQEAGSSNDIEFIIAYYSDEQTHLDCVKNGVLYRDQIVSYIGSDVAFSEFQKARLSEGRDAKKHTQQAFRDVVSGCRDTSVGGRVLEVSYFFDDNTFMYTWERSYTTGKDQIVKPGECINFCTSANDGGYSYEVIHQDIQNVFFNIDQMKPAILYSRQIRIDSSDKENPSLFGLMLPILVEPKPDGTFVVFK